MSVGLLLISHGAIGKALMDEAVGIWGSPPLPCRCLAIQRHIDPVVSLARAESELDARGQGESVLVLTDLYGSTPANVAQKLLAHPRVRIVSGLNLAMLMHIFNYADQQLEALADSASEAAQHAIFPLPPHPGGNCRAE